MNKPVVALLSLACLGLVSAPPQAYSKPSTFTIPVDEVTTPSVVVAPDGQTLIFGLLGHLFEVPVSGGQATQLTFGPSYDSDPAVSPDGKRIAFTSNRDDSGSNIFVLDRTSRRVSRITHEEEATRAAWSPDGKTIAYASDVPREDHPFALIPGFADTALRVLHTVAVAGEATGGQPVTVGKPEAIETVFYLPDGRLARSVRELATGSIMGPRILASRIEVTGADGANQVLASASGDLGRVAPAPRGDGVYYIAADAIQWLAFGTDSKPAPVAGTHVSDRGDRVAIGPDGRTLYFGDAGHLWQVSVAGGEDQNIHFTASVNFQMRPRVAPIARQLLVPAGEHSLRPELAPTLSPDGKNLVVMAGGFLWEQPLTGGPAHRLIPGDAYIRHPAFSPDGQRVVYAASENGQRTLDVYDVATRQIRTLVTMGGAEWPMFPSWSPDGRRIVFQHAGTLGTPSPIVVINVADGTQVEVAKAVGSWLARPQFSTDGRSIYFTSRPDKIAALYRVANAAGSTPVAVTDFKRHVHEALVSPDGKWFAQRRNSEIWVAPMATGVLTDQHLTRFSALGGRSFSFTPDSTAIVYCDGRKIYRRALSGGAPIQLPVDIHVETSAPAPVLISNVHVLDFAAGRFSKPEAIYIEGGRIRWIGSGEPRELPTNVLHVDAHGRYAIPGLFDLHVHSAWYPQQTSPDEFIAFGVTSVRDTGGALDLLNALDDRSRFTALPTPYYFYSGEIMEGMMPLWGDVFYQIGTEQEARAEVDNLQRAGASFVKIYPSLPWKLQGIVSDEAHRVGLPIVGHGLSLEELVRRVVWGSTSVEHSWIAGAHKDVLNLLAATHVVSDPTLAVGGAALMEASDPGWQQDWRVLEYVPATTRSLRGSMGGGASGPQTREALLVQSKGRLDGIDNAYKDGVSLAAGTDSLMRGVHFGLSLHWELGQFVDAGLPAIQVLHMATQGAADVVGASKDLGSLTPGKIADVVLLDKDPLEDIHNTLRIWQVIKGGTIYDPARMRPGIQVPTT